MKSKPSTLWILATLNHIRFYTYLRSITMKVSETKPPSTKLSRKDGVALFLEHEGNKRLRSLFTNLYRRTSGRFTPHDRDVILLTTRGRKSGRERTVILQAFRDGANMVVVAANSGRTSHPDWFLNLMSTPQARVETEDHTLRVRAEQLSDEEASASWPRILERAPSYDRYRKATNRTIPLVRLVPVEEAEDRAPDQTSSAYSGGKATDQRAG